MAKKIGNSVKGFTSAIGGKGLLFALAFCGAAFQGCTTEGAPAAPAGAMDTPSSEAVAEDENGVDFVTDGAVPGAASADASPRALGKAAPGCVELMTWSSGATRKGQAYNRCGRDVRVRFIWRWAGDGPCTQLRNYQTYIESRSWPAYITELRGC